MKRLLPLLLLTCCAVDQGVEAHLKRELPDGSVVSGEFSRKWAGGPVELEAEFDPSTGKWVVRWKSDVDLDAAKRASVAQAEAQAKFLADVSSVLRAVANVATGLPVAQPQAEAAPAQRQEVGHAP